MPPHVKTHAQCLLLGPHFFVCTPSKEDEPFEPLHEYVSPSSGLQLGSLWSYNDNFVFGLKLKEAIHKVW